MNFNKNFLSGDLAIFFWVAALALEFLALSFSPNALAAGCSAFASALSDCAAVLCLAKYLCLAIGSAGAGASKSVSGSVSWSVKMSRVLQVLLSLCSSASCSICLSQRSGCAITLSSVCSMCRDNGRCGGCSPGSSAAWKTLWVLASLAKG